MLQTGDDFLSTLLAQILSFFGFLVCLTISMYGGNEPGKPLPETYTYEQFLEYRRIHGTAATKKKVQEIEAKRSEKAVEQKKKKAVNSKTPPSGAKTSNHVRKSLEEKKEKPKKLLDQLGFSARSKKHKKRDPLAQSDRPKTHHRHHDADAEVFIDEPTRKAAAPLAEHGHGPLVAVSSDFFANKSHTGTTSPSGSSHSKGSPNPNKPPSLFTTLDTSSAVPKHKRLRNKVAALSAPNEPTTSREATTAKESKTAKELRPASFPSPAKSPGKNDGKEDDEFTPTVFEIINAPVKPVMEKPKKKRKATESGNSKPAPPSAHGSTSPIGAKEEKKKNRPLEEDKTIDEDLAVDMEDPTQTQVKPKASLSKVKEQLKEKHQKMIERDKKLEKKKSEQKKKPKDSKKPGNSDPANVSVKKKKTQKSKHSKKKDKPASKPTEKKVPTTAKPDALVGKESTEKTPHPVPTPSDPKDSNPGANDETLREVSAEDCDRTTDDEEPILTSNDEKFIRGCDLRKTQSVRKYAERPPEKLRVVASARIFGHRCENPRLQKAALKAVEKAKKTKKKHVARKAVSKGTSSSSNATSSTTPPASSTS